MIDEIRSRKHPILLESLDQSIKGLYFFSSLWQNGAENTRRVLCILLENLEQTPQKIDNFFTHSRFFRGIMRATTASVGGSSVHLYATNATAAAVRQRDEPTPQKASRASVKAQRSAAAPARGRLLWRRLVDCEEGGGGGGQGGGGGGGGGPGGDVCNLTSATRCRRQGLELSESKLGNLR